MDKVSEVGVTAENRASAAPKGRLNDSQDVYAYVNNLTPDRLHLGDAKGFAVCLPPLATRYPLSEQQYWELQRDRDRLRCSPELEVEGERRLSQTDTVHRVIGIGAAISLALAALSWIGFNLVVAAGVYALALAFTTFLGWRRSRRSASGDDRGKQSRESQGNPNQHAMDQGNGPPRWSSWFRSLRRRGTRSGDRPRNTGDWRVVEEGLAMSALPTVITVIGFGTAIAVSWHLQMERSLVALLEPSLVPGLIGGVEEVTSPRTQVLSVLQQQNDLIFFLVRSVFLALVITFPAAMYFTFEKQRGAALRTRFLLDTFRLDRRFLTVHDIKARYGERMSDVFGAEGEVTDEPGARTGFSLRYSAPLVLSTLALAMTVVLVYSVNVLGSERPPGGILPFLDVVAFALLGAYFYSLNMTVRGYMRGDLQPKTYSQISGRILKVLVLSALIWIVAENWAVLQDQEYIALMLAFFAGIVPNTILTWLYERLRSVTEVARDKLVAVQPLTRLQGVDIYDRARLEQEGVTNVQSLVQGELVDLMLQTRIPTGRLVDWLDQAILLLYTEEGVGNPEARAKGHDLAEELRRVGIRTASQLLTACRLSSGSSDSLADRDLSIADIDQYCNAWWPAKGLPPSDDDPCRLQAQGTAEPASASWLLRQSLRNALIGIAHEPAMRRVLCWRANREPRERMLDDQSISAGAAHCHILTNGDSVLPPDLHRSQGQVLLRTT